MPPLATRWPLAINSGALRPEIELALDLIACRDRVAAMCMLGGFAEVAVAPPWLTFKLPSELDFAQGAALVLNYHTAWFSLKLRGRLAEGETVLVHGAAGGVGTAAIQVAKGLGARTIAVVSSEDKADLCRRGLCRREDALHLRAGSRSERRRAAIGAFALQPWLDWVPIGPHGSSSNGPVAAWSAVSLRLVKKLKLLGCGRR